MGPVRRSTAKAVAAVVVLLTVCGAGAPAAEARAPCNSFAYNNFNVCTFNDLTAAGSEIPFTSQTVNREIQISTAGYTVQSGERLGCVFDNEEEDDDRISWGGKSAWVRFLAGVSGTATVTVGGGTFDAILALRYSPSLEPPSFDDLIHLGCWDYEFEDDERGSARVNAGQPMHIQVRGFCAEQPPPITPANQSLCSNYNTTPPTASGVRTVSIAFTCDNADGDAVCDTLDACPSESGVTSSGCPLRPPIAAFTASPNPALIGQSVSFNASGSTDPDGQVTRYAWDLDGNGSFETNTGGSATASRSYGSPGSLNVRLRVTDNHGNTNDTTRTLTVNSPPPPPPPPPLDPEAKLKFRDTSKGVRISSLVLTDVDRGSRVEVTCRRKSRSVCRRQVVRRATVAGPKARAARTIRFRRLRGKRLRAGTLLAIRVTKAGHIGKYIAYRILRGDFRKSERCIPVGSRKPGRGRCR